MFTISCGLKNLIQQFLYSPLFCSRWSQQTRSCVVRLLHVTPYLTWARKIHVTKLFSQGKKTLLRNNLECFLSPIGWNCSFLTFFFFFFFFICSLVSLVITDLHIKTVLKLLHWSLIVVWFFYYCCLHRFSEIKIYRRLQVARDRKLLRASCDSFLGLTPSLCLFLLLMLKLCKILARTRFFYSPNFLVDWNSSRVC